MQIKYALTGVALSLFLFFGCGSTSRSNTSSTSTDTPSTTTGPDSSSLTPSGTSSSPPLSPTPIPSSLASIDVLVLYDSNVTSSYSNVNTRINHLFAVTNNIYSDSQVNIKVNVKKVLFFDAQKYPALEEIASSSSVQALREEHKADTVLLYQVNPGGEVGLCGTAYGASSYAEEGHFRDAMFAQVGINCPTDTTAHELGHNMGLLHSHKQNGSSAVPFSYGLGHGIEGQFATIMAYTHNFSTNNQVAKFSSPEYECVPGFPCGIAIGQSGEAHATKVLEFTAPKIANLY